MLPRCPTDEKPAARPRGCHKLSPAESGHCNLGYLGASASTKRIGRSPSPVPGEPAIFTADSLRVGRTNGRINARPRLRVWLLRWDANRRDGPVAALEHITVSVVAGRSTASVPSRKTALVHGPRLSAAWHPPGRCCSLSTHDASASSGDLGFSWRRSTHAA